MTLNHTPRRTTASAGFTLIEVLVVVGIIVLLIAILVPALAAARKQGYETRSRAQLSGLKHAVESYYTLFNAYPGPVKENDSYMTAGNFAGIQNVLLGVSRRWAVSATPVGQPALSSAQPFTVGSGTLYWDNSSSNQLMDNSTNRAYSSAFAPTDAVMPNGNVCSGTDPSKFAQVPVFVDRYPDPLPILYYRKTPGRDAISPTGTQIVSKDPTTPAAFYQSSNSAFTNNPKLSTTTGSLQKQNMAAPAPNVGLDKMLKNASTNAPLGAFVLISAGADRVYGPAKRNDSTQDPAMGNKWISDPSGAASYDDIIEAGGQ